MQDDKPVSFASRMLTPTEMKYSVIKKESLAVCFALKKFRRLILFCECELHTDHKPIVGLIRKPVDNLPMRIQRWILTIQGYNVKFHYVKGVSNVLADALSRNPLQCPNQIPADENAEATLCFIAKSLPLNLKQVAESTATDNNLQKVFKQ